MRRAREPLLYLVLLTFWFVLFYTSSDWLALKVPYRIPMAQPNWPFMPQLAPVYLSLNVLLVLSFVVGKRRAELFSALLLQTLVAWPLFVIFPLEPIAIPEAPSSMWFRLADGVNLQANYLPSLHVGYAFSCAFIVRRMWVGGWAAAVSASTVLTYQHYPIDVLAGILLSVSSKPNRSERNEWHHFAASRNSRSQFQ